VGQKLIMMSPNARDAYVRSSRRHLTS
jgi:hypothetical protein